MAELASEPVYNSSVGTPCEKALRDDLAALAKKNDRSLAAEIRVALREHVIRMNGQNE